MAAAKSMLDEIHEGLPQKSNDHSSYILGHIGKNNVPLAGLPNGRYDITSTATVAMQLLSMFRVKILDSQPLWFSSSLLSLITITVL